MSSPSRQVVGTTPAVSLESLRPVHSRPFDTRGAGGTRTGATASPKKTDSTPPRRPLHHSASGSSLPSIKPHAASSAITAAHPADAASHALQSSFSSPNLVQALREYHQARTVSTSNILASFHSHHTNYHFLVQRLSAELTSLLERTHDASVPEGQPQPLSRERADGCMTIMRQLAAASPNSSTFTALVSEVHSALYNTPDGGGVEFREFDPAEALTFWQLCDIMSVKAAGIESELARVQARANYYASHESAERHVLLFTVDNWQRQLQRVAFSDWRTNVSRIRMQRQKLADLWSAFDRRSARARITRCFLLWKYQRVRSRRDDIGPKLLQLAAESAQVEADTAETHLFINQAHNALQELTNKLHELNQEKAELNGDLQQLQIDLSSFKALKLQDVAHVRKSDHTLDLARELLLSLQDELEYYNDPTGPFTHDGYRILQPFVRPKLSEADRRRKKKKAPAASTTLTATSATLAALTLDASDAPTPMGGASTPAPEETTTASPLDSDSLLVAAAAASAPPPPPPEEESFDPIALEEKFASLSDQDVLLQWCNYQLHVYHYRTVPNYDEYQLPLRHRLQQLPPRVANFTTDFELGGTPAPLLQVLETVAPLTNHRQSMNYLLSHEIDADLRARAMAAVICEFNTDIGEMLPPDAFLLAKAPDLVAAFVAKLFCYYPNLAMPKERLKVCLQRLESMKLDRRVVFSRLSRIIVAHEAFANTWVNARRQIGSSRAAATRFLRGMTREQLIGVPRMQAWDDQARAEAARIQAEQDAREEEARRVQAEKDAIAASEKAAFDEQVRKAKEELGLPIRDPQQPATESELPSDEDGADADGGTSEDEPSAPAAAVEAVTSDAAPTTEPSAPTVTGTSADAEAALKPKKRKKLTRLQKAHAFEKARLAAEEAALAAQADADRRDAEAAEAISKAEIPLEPFSPEEAQIYVDYVQRFATEYHALYAEARRAMDRIKRGEEIYRAMQKRMESFIVDVLVRRVNQDPLPIIDHKAHMDYLSFTTVSADRLSDLLPRDATLRMNETQLVQGELANDYGEVCAVFRAYSRVDHSSDRPTDASFVRRGCLLMHFDDWTDLMKDLKMQSRTVKQAALDEVFQQCTEGNVSSTLCLSPSQFVEALVRLAALKYAMSCLADSLALFLKQDIAKKCKKMIPELLRSKFQTNEYLEMLRKHRRKLRKAFLTYAAGNGQNQCTTPSAERNTVDLKDFTSLLKFSKLLGGGEGLSLDDVQSVFVNVKRAEYVCCDNPPSDPDLNRLDYSEFCQALAALATYKNPDPFTPFFARLDHFLTRDFLPAK